jgi:hypothetical protein
MNLIPINRNPSRRQLNVFGAAWLIFFGIVGVMVLRGSGALSTAAAVWAGAVAVPAIGWFRPALMRWVYIGLACATFPIGWVVSHAILAALYYLLLTPLGLLMRLARYDPMAKRFDRGAKTYWGKREESDDPGQYFKQY